MSLFSFLFGRRKGEVESPLEIQEVDSGSGELLVKLSLNRPLTMADLEPEANEDREIAHNTIIIAAKGTSEPYYEVTFKNIGGSISVKCQCRAGEFTQLCKHKLALVRGDSSILYEGDFFQTDEQKNNFQAMQGWVQQSGLAPLILQHDQTQQAFLQKEKEFKQIKEKIELAMRKGV